MKILLTGVCAMAWGYVCIPLFGRTVASAALSILGGVLIGFVAGLRR